MSLEGLTRKMSKYYETHEIKTTYKPNTAKIPTFHTPAPIPQAGQSNHSPSVSKQTGSGANAVGMASADLGAGVAKKQTIPVSQRQFGIGMRQTQAQPQKLPYADKVSASLPQYNAVTPSGGSKVPALPYYQAPGISSDTWKKQAEQLKEDVAQQQKTVRPWQNTSGTMQTASYMKTPQAFQKDGRAMSIEKPESVVRNEQNLSDLKSSLANAQNQGYLTDYSEQWRAIESRDDAEDVKAKLARMASMKNNIGADMGQNIASMNEYQRLRGELESKGINAEGVADWLRRNSNVMEAYYQQQRDAARAEEHPIIESLKTVPQSLYGGTGALAGMTQSAMNSRTGEYRPIDTMGDAFDIARSQQTVRGTVGDNFGQWVYEKTGNQNIANAAKFLYGTAMSGLDSAFIAALGGGATAAIGATGGTAAINGAASIILGSNAASETMMDVVNRGGSTDQAVASGLLAGAAETIFEKVSIDGLISKFKSGEKGFRAFLKNATLQGVSEASEEMATEIANVIADYYVNGGLSEIEQMRQSGMSDVEIANEIAKRVGVAGAGGFLMGFVGGGTSNLTGGISKGGKNRTAAEYAGLYGSYKNSTSTDTSPVDSVSEQGQQVTQTATESAQNRSVQSENAAMSLARQYAGQNISNSQATEILDDPESVKEMTEAGVDLSGTSSQRRKAVKDYVQGIAEQSQQQIPYAPGFNPDSQAAPQQLPRAEQTQPQQIPYNPSSQAVETPVQPTLPRAEELNSERQKNAQEPNLPIYGENTVGSAQVNPESYAHLQNQYGTVEPGENPARTIDMPVKDAQGQTNSLFARTIAESESMPNEMVPEWEQAVASGEFSHDIATDKAATRHAERELGKGWDYAMRQWQAVSEGDKVATKNDLALGQLLLANAMKDGDTQTAMKLAAELCAEATRAGQAVQSFRLLKKMTPEGMLYYLQKTVNNLNNDFEGRKGFEGIKIDEGMAERLGKATTREEMNAIVDEIKQDIAAQIPVSIWDIWNAWRYLAMLGNPTTHIRNIVGNAVFAPVISVKNGLAAAIESGVKKANGGQLSSAQKAIVSKRDAADKALLDFAEGDYEAIEAAEFGSDKYSSDKGDILARRQILPGILGKLSDWNSSLLRLEDRWFSRPRYIKSLASYMKANGLTADSITSEQLAKAREYAIKEAKKATYQDDAALADMIKGFKTKARQFQRSDNKGKKVVGYAAEGFVDSLMPFTKTPVNIVKRGLEYSPANIVNVVYDLTQVKSGKKTASDVIDAIATTLTGTGLLALGYALANMGWVSGGGEDDKEDKYRQMLGEQHYSLDVGKMLKDMLGWMGIDYDEENAGTYTIDWLAPEALPFFVGVAASEDVKTGELGIDSFVDALSALGDPIIELSMMSGLNDALNSVSYGNNALSALFSNQVSSYLSQGVPTIGGKFNRTIDKTSRQTYYDPNKGALTKTVDVFAQKAAQKIPFASYALQPRIDAWGRTEENTGGNFVGRLGYNMTSPGYYEKKSATDVDKELLRLYDKTGETSVLPSYAAKTWTLPKDDGGDKVKLTAKEYTEYAKDKGSKAYDIFDSLIDSQTYKSMSNDDKVEVAIKVYEYANAVAKSNVSDYTLRDTAAKIQKCEKAGIPAGVAIVAYVAQKDVKGDKDSKGNTIQLSASKNKKEAIDRMTPFINKKQRELLYDLFEVSEKVW